MSRYCVRGINPRHRLIVGWDRPAGSFFAQVEDLAWENHGTVIDENAMIGDTPEEGLLLWVGCDEPLLDVTVIQQVLAPYGSVPEETIACLERDRVGALSEE